MTERRDESPDAWAVGWWPVRDASEAVLWRPVSRDGWTYRAEGEGWAPVERVPPRARVWRHRHGFADAGALDVFEFPAGGDDVPEVDARPARRWPMLAPQAPTAAADCNIVTVDPAEQVEPAPAPVEAPDLEPDLPTQAPPAAAPVPYVPPPPPPPTPRTARPLARRNDPLRDALRRERHRREVDAVRAALTDPEDVARRLGYCEGRAGGRGCSWMREGNGVKIRCPGHNENTPSCGVTRGPDGTLRVHCHAGCGLSGDVFNLLAAHHGVDLRARFRDVLAVAAEMAGVPLDAPADALPSPPPRPAPPAEQEVDREEFIAVAAALLVVAPLDAAVAADVRAYLAGRGILGGALADGWGALPATRDGLARVRREVIAATSRDAWMRSGLAWDDGWWMHQAHRVVIPWRDTSGRIAWLQRRAIVDHGGPRYVARARSGAAMPYGVERLRDAGDGCAVAVTEGAVDALALRAACERDGVRAVILGAPGPVWRAEWNEILRGRDVAVASDDDASGDRFAARIAPDIQRFARSVQRWRPTGAKDWCAAWQAKTA